MPIFKRKLAEKKAIQDASSAQDHLLPQSDAEKVLDLAILLSQQDDFQEILRLISEKGLTLFNADSLSVMMVNPKTQHTIKTVMKKGTTHEEHSHHVLRIHITGWVMKQLQSFLSEDLSTDPRIPRNLMAGSGVCSAMCVPMQNEKQICGQIFVTSQDRARRFAREDLQFLEKCAAVWGAFTNRPRLVQEYFQTLVPDDVLVSKYVPLGLLGRSRRFKELLRSVDAASNCDVRVFLEGQSGSGKEVVARAIHTIGPRQGHPFVAIDCGAIPANLMESELFGHAKGAFTGASQARRGLLDEANGGTLFMDEIENLPYEMQSKFLRVLQEGEVRAVGSNSTRKVDVRIITASSTPGARLVKEKVMREDLFYRLHVYPITIPTLHERKEDIPLLAEHFAQQFSARQRKKAVSFQPSLVHFMREKVWQGNVRELENFVERMVTVASPDTTILDDTLLPEEYFGEYRSISRSHSVHPSPRPLRESMREHESQMIRNALVAHGWNQSEAARSLCISERDMRYKMTKLGIGKPDFPTDKTS